MNKVILKQKLIQSGFYVFHFDVIGLLALLNIKYVDEVGVVLSL